MRTTSFGRSQRPIWAMMDAVVARHGRLDVGDNTGHGRDSQQTRGDQLPLHLH